VRKKKRHITHVTFPETVKCVTASGHKSVPERVLHQYIRVSIMILTVGKGQDSGNSPIRLRDIRKQTATLSRVQGIQKHAADL
jgi:hypothetical protein